MGIVLQFRLRAITAHARLRALAGAVMPALRDRAGLRLICWALRVLPRQSLTREHLLALLRDLRGFERYRAYCVIQGTAPLSFTRWRTEQLRVGWFARQMRRVA
jgi:hypothetical protein